MEGRHVSIPTNLTPSGESTWVGIGGGVANEATGSLIQAGTSMSTGNGYQAWWEYVGFVNKQSSGGNLEQGATHVTAGDSVSALVDWTTDSNSQFCFTFTDNTNSAASFSGCSSATDVTYDHDSAEWVNEWPVHLVGNKLIAYRYYQDPGPIYFTDQKLSTGFGGAGPWTPAFATANTGLVMVTPSTVEPVNVACGPGSDVVAYGINAQDLVGGNGTSEIYPCPYPDYDS